MHKLNNINDDIKNLIAPILSTADIFNSFNGDTKSIIKQCLKIDRDINTQNTDGLAEVLSAILSMPAKEQTAIKTLYRLAEETQDITKSFIIASSTDDELKAIQNVLLSVNQNYSPKTNIHDNKIAFYKELYDGIETLSISTIKALDKLLTLITIMSQYEPNYPNTLHAMSTIYNQNPVIKQYKELLCNKEKYEKLMKDESLSAEERETYKKLRNKTKLILNSEAGTKIARSDNDKTHADIANSINKADNSK